IFVRHPIILACRIYKMDWKYLQVQIIKLFTDADNMVSVSSIKLFLYTNRKIYHSPFYEKSTESYSEILLSTDPRNKGGGNPRSNINDDTYKNNDGILDRRPYTFNGKVILGIGVILAA